MAKESGIGDQLLVEGHNISGDVASLGAINGGLSTLDVTAIDKNAMERLHGLKDGTMTFTSYWDSNPDGAIETLKGLPRTDIVANYMRGNAAGVWTAGMTGKQINFDWTRDASGGLTSVTSIVSNASPLDWAQVLTAGIEVQAVPTDGVAVDFGASTAFGAQIWYQVLAFTGTDILIEAEHSTDDITYAAFSGVTFTGQAAERRAATGLINRWTRIRTTGTFTSATIMVAVNRNEVPTAQ